MKMGETWRIWRRGSRSPASQEAGLGAVNKREEAEKNTEPSDGRRHLESSDHEGQLRANVGA